jgi:hypothetical protein
MKLRNQKKKLNEPFDNEHRASRKYIERVRQAEEAEEEIKEYQLELFPQEEQANENRPTKRRVN